MIIIEKIKPVLLRSLSGKNLKIKDNTDGEFSGKFHRFENMGYPLNYSVGLKIKRLLFIQYNNICNLYILRPKLVQLGGGNFDFSRVLLDL